MPLCSLQKSREYIHLLKKLLKTSQTVQWYSGRNLGYISNAFYIHGNNSSGLFETAASKEMDRQSMVGFQTWLQENLENGMLCLHCCCWDASMRQSVVSRSTTSVQHRAYDLVRYRCKKKSLSQSNIMLWFKNICIGCQDMAEHILQSY